MFHNGALAFDGMNKQRLAKYPAFSHVLSKNVDNEQIFIAIDAPPYWKM
jgi:hypothetical protein